jgi:myosin heavy subunit
MLVPSPSRTSEIRDLADQIFTNVLGANKSEGLDEYQLGPTEVYFGAGTLAFLEKLRTSRLDHGATVIQKNLKAKYYRRKYLEAQKAIILVQAVTRRHLAWKHIQETRKIQAAITMQRVWRGQKQRKGFSVIRNNVILIQAAAKGFLRRREIMDTSVRKAALLIQRVWRLRKHMKTWRRKVVIVQSLWRGKCARRRCEKIRQVAASSDVAGQVDHANDRMANDRMANDRMANDRMANLPAHWQTQLQRIKSTEVLKDCQHFCHTVRHPVTSIDVRPNQDALKQSGGPDNIPTRDRRLKQLKFILEDGWEKEKSFETPKIVLKVSRRVHLVELRASYEAEKTKSEKRGEPSAMEKFVDILFPHTINGKSEKADKEKKGERGNKRKKGEKGNKRKKGEKGNKRKKGKVTNQKDEQLSEQEVRKKAERKLEYWLRLTKPLWTMSKRYGLPILVVIPQEITETRYALL